MLIDNLSVCHIWVLHEWLKELRMLREASDEISM